MPCHVDVDPDQERRELEKKFTHNSKVAEMLCAMMKGLEAHGNMQAVYNSMTNKMQKRVRDWWSEHQERDRKKEEAEQRDQHERTRRANALEKLTPEEGRLLGVKDR